MSQTLQTTDDYRTQIERCAQAMALAQNEIVVEDVDGADALAKVKMFTDGNLDKRFLKLRDQFEYMEDAFVDLEELIVEYVRTVPLAAYDSNTSDSERFFGWLCTHYGLTDEQMDYVTCQRSRNAVERLAEDHRLEHVHFQEIRSASEELVEAWGVDENVRLHLNPIHVGATFHTKVLLDQDDVVPARVVFFPVGGDIRTAILEPEGRRIVRALNEAGPLRMEELAAILSSFDRETLVEVARDLAEIGLAAFG